MTLEENEKLFYTYYVKKVEEAKTIEHVLPYPLYHGTDKKVLDLSDEDRKTLKQECFNVLDYLYKVLKDEDFLHTKGFQNLENDRQRMEIATVFVDVQSYYEESGLFQYNDIYFSIAAAEAAEYAKHANYFGEIGYYTYFFYEGYLLNHKELLPYEIQKAFNHIEAFSKKKIRTYYYDLL